MESQEFGPWVLNCSFSNAFEMVWKFTDDAVQVFSTSSNPKCNSDKL
jgi:hypothetical protein